MWKSCKHASRKIYLIRDKRMDVTKQVIDELYHIAQVVSAKYQHNYIYDRDDLIQIAVSAALPCLSRYDAGKGKLSTFLQRRMHGAIQDELRLYLRPRNLEDAYKDHKTRRFSQLEGVLESGSFSEDHVHNQDWYCPDYREHQPGYHEEVRDQLNNWRTSHLISMEEWSLLWWRFGQGFSQKQIAELFGCHPSRISQMEAAIRKYIGIEVLPRAYMIRTETQTQSRIANGHKLGKIHAEKCARRKESTKSIVAQYDNRPDTKNHVLQRRMR